MKDPERCVLGFTPYQWLVLFAAWLGWGFDVFDALLFNYVGRLCIPSLLNVPPSDKQTITQWIGILTSLPDAIITRAYVPIMSTGVLFGAIAGWIVGRWGLALT